MLTNVLKKVQYITDVISRWTSGGHLLLRLNRVNFVAHDFYDFWDRLFVFPLSCRGFLYNIIGSRRCVLMTWAGGDLLDLGDGGKVVRRGREGVWVFILTVWQHTDNLAEVWGSRETTQSLLEKHYFFGTNCVAPERHDASTYNDVIMSTMASQITSLTIV